MKSQRITILVAAAAAFAEIGLVSLQALTEPPRTFCRFVPERSDDFAGKIKNAEEWNSYLSDFAAT